MPMMHIDGSNLGSGKASAWACVIELDRNQVPAPMHNQVLSGAFAEGTIGRMELMALTHALLAIDAFAEAAQGSAAGATAFVRPSDIWTITTDSQFVANGFNDWMEGWARNAWRKSGNKGEFLSKQIELGLPSEASTTAQSPAEPTAEPAEKVAQTSDTTAPGQMVPISELTAKHGYVLIIGPSGYQGTPFRAAVGRMTPGGRIVDHAGDLFTDGGEDATHFLPLPWNNG